MPGEVGLARPGRPLHRERRAVELVDGFDHRADQVVARLRQRGAAEQPRRRPAEQVDAGVARQRREGVDDQAGEVGDRLVLGRGPHRAAGQHRDRPVRGGRVRRAALLQRQLHGRRGDDLGVAGGVAVAQPHVVTGRERVRPVRVAREEQRPLGVADAPGGRHPLPRFQRNRDGAGGVDLEVAERGGQLAEVLPPRRVGLPAVVADRRRQQRAGAFVGGEVARVVREPVEQRVDQRGQLRGAFGAPFGGEILFGLADQRVLGGFLDRLGQLDAGVGADLVEELEQPPGRNAVVLGVFADAAQDLVRAFRLAGPGERQVLLVRLDVGQRGLHAAFAGAGPEERLEVPDRVRPLRHAQSLAHHRVQVHDGAPAQQLVDLLLAGPVHRREPLDRGDLVRRVVVDVRAGVLGDAGRGEVDELLERPLLLGAAVRPERREPLAAVGGDRAEEVVQALTRQRVRIARQIEEDVARRGRRQLGERAGVDDLVGDVAGGVLPDLQRGLGTQVRERRRRQVAWPVGGPGLGERVDRAQPGGDELAALVAAHPGDEREVAVGLPGRRAVLGEAAAGAGRAFVGPEPGRQPGFAAVQPGPQPLDQRPEVVDPQRPGAAVTQPQVHVRAGGPPAPAQRVGDRGQPHDGGGVGLPDRRRVVDLVAAFVVLDQEVRARRRTRRRAGRPGGSSAPRTAGPPRSPSPRPGSATSGRARPGAGRGAPGRPAASACLRTLRCSHSSRSARSAGVYIAAKSDTPLHPAGAHRRRHADRPPTRTPARCSRTRGGALAARVRQKSNGRTVAPGAAARPPTRRCHNARPAGVLGPTSEGDTMSENTEVVVIGGGYAGVMAANRLTQRDDVERHPDQPAPRFRRAHPPAPADRRLPQRRHRLPGGPGRARPAGRRHRGPDRRGRTHRDTRRRRHARLRLPGLRRRQRQRRDGRARRGRLRPPRRDFRGRTTAPRGPRRRSGRGGDGGRRRARRHRDRRRTRRAGPRRDARLRRGARPVPAPAGTPFGGQAPGRAGRHDPRRRRRDRGDPRPACDSTTAASCRAR